MDITQTLLTKTDVRPLETPLRSVTSKTDEGCQTQAAAQLRSAAQQFETVFLHQILKQMKESVDYASLDEEDESGEQIQSMYWSFMADHLGQQGGLGFWKTIYNDLAAAQGIDPVRYPAQGPGLDEHI